MVIVIHAYHNQTCHGYTHQSTLGSAREYLRELIQYPYYSKQTEYGDYSVQDHDTRDNTTLLSENKHHQSNTEARSSFSFIASQLPPSQPHPLIRPSTAVNLASSIQDSAYPSSAASLLNTNTLHSSRVASGHCVVVRHGDPHAKFAQSPPLARL